MCIVMPVLQIEFYKLFISVLQIELDKRLKFSVLHQ